MYVETPDDYRLKFEGTIVKHGNKLIKLMDFGDDLPHDDEVLLASVLEVSPRGYHKINSEDGMFVRLKKDQFDWKYPELGWINTHKQAVYIRRAPGQNRVKFKKALHPSGLMINFYPTINDGFLIEKEWSTIYYIFNSTFFSIEKAIDIVFSGKRHCVAINDTYALVADFMTNQVKVMRGPHVIGLVDRNSVVSLPATAVFLMEELLSNGFDKIELC